MLDLSLATAACLALHSSDSSSASCLMCSLVSLLVAGFAAQGWSPGVAASQSARRAGRPHAVQVLSGNCCEITCFNTYNTLDSASVRLILTRWDQGTKGRAGGDDQHKQQDGTPAVWVQPHANCTAYLRSFMMHRTFWRKGHTWVDPAPMASVHGRRHFQCTNKARSMQAVTLSASYMRVRGPTAGICDDEVGACYCNGTMGRIPAPEGSPPGV